eukprot:1714269-Ditylum_brightwellii.AAC.1
MSPVIRIVRTVRNFNLCSVMADNKFLSLHIHTRTLTNYTIASATLTVAVSSSTCWADLDTGKISYNLQSPLQINNFLAKILTKMLVMNHEQYGIDHCCPISWRHSIPSKLFWRARVLTCCFRLVVSLSLIHISEPTRP